MAERTDREQRIWDILKGVSVDRSIAEHAPPPPPWWIDFGRTLYERRKAAQLTQQALADRMYLDHTTISHWESGRLQPPSTETIRALADALDVDPIVFYRHIYIADVPSMSRSHLEARVAELERRCTTAALMLNDYTWRNNDASVVSVIVGVLRDGR